MIETKPKKCKGIGKANGVKGCEKEFLYRTYGLCNSCLSDFLFDTDAGKMIYHSKIIPKAKEKFKKQVKKADNETRQSLKTLSQYEADAKKSFQKWVRLRDADLPCISCGTVKNVEYAGGHYFDAGMFSGLIFDERNVNKQCNVFCNKHKSGNKTEYRKGLVERYGQNFVTALESESNGLRNRKYTKIELIEIKRLYDAKVKEFERSDL